MEQIIQISNDAKEIYNNKEANYANDTSHLNKNKRKRNTKLLLKFYNQNYDFEDLELFLNEVIKYRSINGLLPE